MGICLTKKSFIFTLLIVSLFAGSNPAVGAEGKNVVIIDPAHGGTDMGVKLSRNTYEKDLTLAIGKLMEERLGKIRSIKARLTRSKDISVTIEKRTETAKNAKADLFVSIHVNAGFGNKSSGYEIYFSGFKKPSAKKENSNEIVKDMVRNQYLNDSVRFAQIFQRNFSKVFPREDRGLRDAPFLVYEGLTMPSVAIELGFATNIKNKKKLTSKETQKEIANALVKSIREHFATSGG